jgi:transcriptional regulator with XRE-family HTH domain
VSAAIENHRTRLRDARKAAGLTQTELALQAACSLAYVRAVEGGFRPANPDRAAAWARILSVLEVDPENDERRPAAAGAVQDREGPSRCSTG